MGSRADITSPVEHLLTVRRIVDKYGPPEVKQWFCEALDRAIFDGQDLGRALGLNSSGRGQESGLTLWRRYERDGFLKIAFSFVEGDCTAERVERLRELIKELEFAWPRYEKYETPPKSLGSGLWLALYKARKLGRLPTGRSQLWEIVGEREQ
jgi:hypothetical protein